MKHKLHGFLLVILTMMTIVASAQDSAPTAFVVQMGTNGAPQLGEVPLPGASISVDWNPQSSTSWARVDDFGMLRFAPINSPEGVYSFSPYFQGYSTPSREENRLFVDEVDWSPNGQQLAFRLDSGSEVGSDGVWFWQPAIETATDPSYHLLRDCPPGCGLANARDTEKWQSLSIDWSPDNITILVHMYLPEEDRNAIGLVFASRDPESPQADIQPPTYRYEYGSWTVDGERLVVSGYNPDGNAVYGFLNRDGTNPQVSLASSINLEYVRNAVTNPTTGELLMLGSPVGEGAAVAIYNALGQPLTPPIGNVAPQYVEWSPNHDAVLIRAGDHTFIATVAGDVYDITETVIDNPMVTWVEAGFPENTVTLPLTDPTTLEPEPTPVRITLTDVTPLPDDDEDTVEAQSIPSPESDFAVGQLLQVAVDEITLYAEPIAGADEVATLEEGEAMVLIGGPLTDGETVWWRIQSLDSMGWIEESINGVAQISS